MAMSRSAGSIWLPPLPPMSISPPVTVSSPATMRNSVDLPQPEGPTSTQNWPSPTSTSTPLMASKPFGYALRTSCSVTLAIGLFLRLDQALDEEALHQDDDGDRRQHGEHGGGHRHRPFGQGVMYVDDLFDADDDGLHVVARRDQQRPQILIPAVDEEDHEQGCDVGHRQRQ